MPVVTVRVKPNGLPIAITGSPTWAVSELPRGSGRSLALSGLTLSTARSLEGSRPLTWAGTKSPFSPKRTRTSEAPSTTWALVRIVPSLSTTKPEPVAVPCCGSPNGESVLVTPRDWMNTTPVPSFL